MPSEADQFKKCEDALNNINDTLRGVISNFKDSIIIINAVIKSNDDWLDEISKIKIKVEYEGGKINNMIEKLNKMEKETDALKKLL